MATSGSTDLGTTGTELAYTAMQILGQYGSDITTLATEDSTLALKMLNWYMKHLQAKQGFLWKTAVAYLFLDGSNLTYTLSTSGSHATESYSTTTTSALAAANATTLTVTSTTGMTTNDTIVIPKSDDTYQSTTITVASSTSLTLGTGLTEALASGSRIYTYTTKLSKPIRIHTFATRHYDSSGTFNDYERKITTFNDYQSMTPDKVYQGEPLSIAYLPLRTTGKVYVRGLNEDLTRIGVITIQKEIEDIDSGSNEPDYPSEWFLPLAFKLAYYLSFILEFDSQARQELGAEADRLIADTLSNDYESAALEITNRMR